MLTNRFAHICTIYIGALGQAEKHVLIYLGSALISRDGNHVMKSHNSGWPSEILWLICLEKNVIFIVVQLTVTMYKEFVCFKSCFCSVVRKTNIRTGKYFHVLEIGLIAYVEITCISFVDLNLSFTFD